MKTRISQIYASRMNQEAEWLRAYGRRRRLRKIREQRRLLMGLSIATLLQRVIYFISCVVLLLLLTSMIMNWGKTGIARQGVEAIIGLILINGVAWFLQRLLRSFVPRT